MNKVKSMLRSTNVGIHSIQDDATVAEALERFLSEEVSSLLVCRGEQMVGIFTKNDLVRSCAQRGEDPRTFKVGDLMKKDLFTATPDDDLEEVMSEMIHRSFHYVPVLEDGAPIGMITSVDILTHQKETLLVAKEELLRYIRGSY